MDDLLYNTLQVDSSAESEVIRAAPHALARESHLDAGGDPGRMVELNAAWDVLGTPSLRTAYDAEPLRTPPVIAKRADEHRYDAEHGGDRPVRSAQDSSSMLDWGRYVGWTLEQLAAKDPDYLEWLARTSIGRRMAPEVRALLGARKAFLKDGNTWHRGLQGGRTSNHGERGSSGRQWFGRGS